MFSPLIGTPLIPIPEMESKIKVEIPMIVPPIALQKKPAVVTPPFVPEGTRLQGWVINLGDDLLNIPISLANVSAKQVA